MLDHDNQVVAVQRVVSPADCTVSQSTLSVGPEGGDGQPTTTLLTMPPMVRLDFISVQSLFNIPTTPPAYRDAARHLSSGETWQLFSLWSLFNIPTSALWNCSLFRRRWDLAFFCLIFYFSVRLPRHVLAVSSMVRLGGFFSFFCQIFCLISPPAYRDMCSPLQWWETWQLFIQSFI